MPYTVPTFTLRARAPTVHEAHRVIDQRIEMEKSLRLTYGNSTYFTDMDGITQSLVTTDGLPLFSPSHPSMGWETVSNIGNRELMEDSLLYALAGHLPLANTLIVGRRLRQDAGRILLANRLSHIRLEVWRYLGCDAQGRMTWPNIWFLADTRRSTAICEMLSTSTDPALLTLDPTVRKRFRLGIVTHNWLYGSFPD